MTGQRKMTFLKCKYILYTDSTHYTSILFQAHEKKIFHTFFSSCALHIAIASMYGWMVKTAQMLSYTAAEKVFFA